MKKQKEEYLTHAPKEQLVSVATDGRGPDLNNYPGDSVNEHTAQETANAIIAEGEIGQQMENN